jgi:hypothetical protein
MPIAPSGNRWIRWTAILFFNACLSHAGAPVFDSNRAFNDLAKQCAFGPRVPGSKAHADCLAFLLAQLRSCTDKVRTQPFAAVEALRARAFRFTNIIASFGPSRDRVLLCAHWDSRAWADSDPEPKNRRKPVPGANDGASGAAVLLEMARLFKQNPPPIGVDLVWFDGEDGGLQERPDTWCLGSKYFAASLVQGLKPRAAVLIDMVGDRDLHLPVERNSQRYAPQLVQRIWGAAKRLGLPAFDPAPGYEIVDDHLELLNVGIPSVDIIDLDYPNYHTIGDTADKCSAESLWTVGHLLVHVVYNPGLI